MPEDQIPDSDSSNSSSSPRSCGGRPGNQNARTHGFYSKLFKDSEVADLENMPDRSLEDEIGMLRVIIRRYALNIDKAETLQDQIKLGRVLYNYINILARITRTQYVEIRSDPNEDFNKELKSAVEFYASKVRPGYIEKYDEDDNVFYVRDGKIYREIDGVMVEYDHGNDPSFFLGLSPFTPSLF